MFFFFLPVGMNYRTERLPIVTLSLIGLNTLVYLVSLVCYFTTDGESECLDHATSLADPGAIASVDSYFTSMFVHAGFFHLLGNMIFLFLFGACVEDIIGRLRFASFTCWAAWWRNSSMIAMSPAAFHVADPDGRRVGRHQHVHGHVSAAARRRGHRVQVFLMVVLRFHGAGEFEMPAWMAISFWFLEGSVLGRDWMFCTDSGGGVAFGAHVGGFLGGLGLVGIYKWSRAKADASVTADGRLMIASSSRREWPRSTSRRAPVAEARPETPTIFLHDGSAQTGPFTLAQVQAKLQGRGDRPRRALIGAKAWTTGRTWWIWPASRWSSVASGGGVANFSAQQKANYL